MSETEKKEKSQAAQLKEKLAAKKPSGALELDKEKIALADEFCEGYKKFINTSKVEREAVKTTEQIALDHGFEKFDINFLSDLKDV